MDQYLKVLHEFEYRREQLLQEAKEERERREEVRKLQQTPPKEILKKAA